MHRLAIPLYILLIQCTWTAHAEDSPDSPLYWLDRAAAELKRVEPGQQDELLPGISLLNVAEIVYTLDPSDARREWLAAVAARAEQQLNQIQPPMRRAAAVAMLMRIHRVLLRNQDAYQRHLEQFRRMISAGEIEGNFLLTVDEMLCQVLADVGDRDALAIEIGRLPDPAERIDRYVKIARLAARMDPQEARSHIESALRIAKDSEEHRRRALGNLAETFAHLGDFDQALESLARVESSRQALHSAVRLMELAHAAGRQTAYASFYGRADREARMGDPGDHLLLAHAVMELGDRQRAGEQARAAIARFDEEVPWWHCARLAAMLAWGEDRAAYRRWIDRAQVAVNRIVIPAANAPPPTEQALIEEELGFAAPRRDAGDAAKEKARGHLAIATAAVYAGDLELMRRQIDAARAVEGAPDGDSLDERMALIAALRRTGRLDEAASQLNLVKDQGWRDFDDERLAQAFAAAGRLDAAEAHARRCQRFYRFGAWCRIIRQRIAVGKLDGLDKWVDELQTPMQRAMAAAFAAHCLSGKPPGRYWWMLLRD